MEVSLRTPWPAPDGEGEQGERAAREGGHGVVTREKTQGGSAKVLTRKRLSLLAVTTDDECDQELGSEVNDELLEFSYTEEPPHV